MIRTAVILLSFLSPLLFLNPGMAEEASNLDEKEIKSNLPVQITSKKMVVNNQEKVMTFEGEVKVVKGDLTMTSNRVKVYFKNKSASLNRQEISLIEAEGNVHLVRGKREAKADKAEYHKEEEMIILTGSPEGWDNQYKVSGSKMTIFLKEDRSIIEESHILFNP
jgi:lipopolysaccharide export system protein LptA